MPRIYVQCKFREGDRKSYMYHVDEDFGLRVGDVVKVPGKHPGDGWQRATLVEILGEIAPPKFTTKPILGKVPRAELEAEVAKRFPADPPKHTPPAPVGDLFDRNDLGNAFFDRNDRLFRR